MGIVDLRREFLEKPEMSVPGAERLVMHYEDGGRVQVFSIDSVSARVGPTATSVEIRDALLEAIKS